MNEFSEERRKYAIDELIQKLDQHFEYETRARAEYSSKLSDVESDLKSLSSSTQRMAEILERLAIAEERDKTHGTSILKLQEKLENAESLHSSLRQDTNKWKYSIAGALAAISTIASVFGSQMNSKITDYDVTMEKIKIHLEVDKPTGWPAESKLPQQNQPR